MPIKPLSKSESSANLKKKKKNVEGKVNMLIMKKEKKARKTQQKEHRQL